MPTKKKLLFCSGEGIGNVIQTIPVVRTLKEVLGYEIDFWYAFGSYGMPKVIPYVDKWIRAGEIMQINPQEYVGKVSTKWTAGHINHGALRSLPLLNSISDLTMTRSEVDVYMDIARDLGAKDFIWTGDCICNPSRKKYDVVIHDGYNRKASNSDWRLKSYPRYAEVSKLLQKEGLSVCSVGTQGEHVPSTANETGLPLLDTLGVMKNSRVFLGNDSGMYHCANALSIPNVVIFTYTSTEKNYDARFHKHAKIVGRDDLECRWCQCNPRFKTCITRECRNIDPKIVVDAVMEKLNG